MKAKIICIAILVSSICLLACKVYTQPKHIQDDMTIINIDNGEQLHLKLDLYQKKSLVRPTKFYGSVWLNDKEYICLYDAKINFQNLKQKLKELFSFPNNIIGNFINQNAKQLTDDYLLIANYKSEGYGIRIGLTGSKCPFPTGTYLDIETAKRLKEENIIFWE